MGLMKEQREKISLEVIKTLLTRFDNFPENSMNNRNAPFHEAFLSAFSDRFSNRVSDVPFFISLSSWLHGLNTTLGQSFFEKVAHHLCNGGKREYTSKKDGNLKISKKQREHISSLIANLSNKTLSPSLKEEDNLLLKEYNDEKVDAMDFSADIFIEDEDTIIAIELKSVRPNSGEMRGEKQKILEGKAALYTKFPQKEIKFFIGFPFDPTVDPNQGESVYGHNKERFLSSIINMKAYFDSNETLVADELWDMLSGNKNTMKEILEIINKISTTDFLDKFKFLRDNSKRKSTEYKKQLLEWNLFSELELVNQDDNILKNINGDKRLLRLYNNTCFDDKGNYHIDRFNKLFQVYSKK